MNFIEKQEDYENEFIKQQDIEKRRLMIFPNYNESYLNSNQNIELDNFKDLKYLELANIYPSYLAADLEYFLSKIDSINNILLENLNENLKQINSKREQNIRQEE